MKSLFIFLLLFVAASLFSRNVYATTVEYHPDINARLGFGFNPTSPQVVFTRECVKFATDEPIDSKTGAVIDAKADILEITDRTTLLQATGISTSVEASSGLFYGSSSFSQNVSVSFDSTSFVWITKAYVSFGRWGLKGAEPAKLLLEANTPADVERICGREIFTQETRGAIAAVIFEFQGLSTTQKSNLSLALKAAKSGPGVNGELDSKFRTAIEEARSTSKLNTQVHFQGGPGRAALASIIESPSDLTKVRKTLASYIEGTNTGNAKPLKYDTSPTDQFKKVHFSAPPDLAQDRIWEIYQQYSQLTALVRRINELTRPTSEADEYLRKYITDQKRTELAKTRDEYEDMRDQLRNAGLKCLAGVKNCRVPSTAGLARIA